MVGRERGAEDVVGHLLGGHDRRCVQIPVGDDRKDRGVDDAQPIDAVDAPSAIDDRHRVGRSTHLAGAARMVRALEVLDEELNELAAEHPDLLYEKIYHYASD